MSQEEILFRRSGWIGSNREGWKFGWVKRLVNCIFFFFNSRMGAAMKELAPGNGIVMKESEDGSGRGAAIVAAVACRLKAAGEYK